MCMDRHECMYVYAYEKLWTETESCFVCHALMVNLLSVPCSYAAPIPHLTSPHTPQPPSVLCLYFDLKFCARALHNNISSYSI